MIRSSVTWRVCWTTINGNKLWLNIYVNFIQNFFKIYNVALSAMGNIYTVFRSFFYNNQMKFVKERIQTSIHHVTTMHVYTQEYENPH